MADAPFGFAPQDMMQGTAPVEGAGQYLAPIMEMYRRKLDPQTYISMAKSLLSLPQRSMEAAREGAAGGPIDVGPAMETAMSMGGARFPFIGRGEAGIFGGRLAATADKAALAKAEDMLAKGATPESIWKDTGWFQGGDGKWRFEIPDKGMTASPGSGNYWDAAIEHPDFFSAYPHLRSREANIHFGEPRGSFWGEGMQVIAPTRDAMGSITAHEMQHAVQAREGFSGGASPTNIALELSEHTGNPIIEGLRSAIVRGEYGMPGDKTFSQAARSLLELERQNRVERSLDEYRRHAGEVEARNVQKRLNMTPEERKATPPWLTEDVPREQQIIRPASGGSFGSWAP